MSSSQTIVLITGANQGIGYEAAKNLVLASPSYHVLVGSRSLPNGEKAVSSIEALPDLKGTVSPIQIDVTDDSSVEAAAKLVAATYGRLDTLVNNAGVGEKSDVPHIALRQCLATNTVGPVLVTDFFLDLLKKSSKPRLVFVSSSGGSLTHAADPNSPFYGSKTALHFSYYRASKAALNMLIIQYWKTLGETAGFKVMGADPGLVATNFMDAEKVRALGAPEPEVGGATVAEVVKGERDADMGRVVGRYGVSPW